MTHASPSVPQEKATCVKVFSFLSVLLNDEHVACVHISLTKACYMDMCNIEVGEQLQYWEGFRNQKTENIGYVALMTSTETII